MAMNYRVAIVGRRKLRNTIKSRDTAIQQMNEIIIELQGEVSELEAQVSQLQSDLADAQDLAQQRLIIIYRKNGYIQELQTILDNEGIPYPPEPTA